MAARKSCTHLTWAQAKANSGIASGVKKNKAVLRKQDHSDLLAQKIIAKNAASKAEISQHRAAEKRARKEEHRAQELAQRRLEEKERQRLEDMVKPSEQAVERMRSLASKMQQQADTSLSNNQTVHEIDMDDLDKMKKIAECRAMQLDELMALEAILNIEEDDIQACKTAHHCEIEDLRQKMEQHQEDEDNLEVLRSIAKHPPLSFTLELNVNDEGNACSTDLELAAAILLKVTLPPHYPLYCEEEDTNRCLPAFEIVDAMVTDSHAVCSPDKALESLAFFDQQRDASIESLLHEKVREILPDPCIYEVAVMWLSEHAFEHLTLRTHASVL